MGILDGKAVVVTGAGRGLGEAYAMHAAQAGARLVVNDVDSDFAERTAAHIRDYGGEAVASTHNVADPVDAAAIIEYCVDAYGQINGLVNNAGVNYDAQPWDDSPDRMRELFEINVFGTFNCGIAAIKAMRDAGVTGSIVNIASGALLGQQGRRGVADLLVGAGPGHAGHPRQRGLPGRAYQDGLDIRAQPARHTAGADPEQGRPAGAVPAVRPLRRHHRPAHPLQRPGPARGRPAVLQAADPVQRELGHRERRAGVQRRAPVAPGTVRPREADATPAARTAHPEPQRVGPRWRATRAPPTDPARVPPLGE